MARKPITVDGQLFNSKDALKKYIRSIVSRYKDDEILAEADLQFVNSLLDFHRWRDDKIGVGVASMTVRTNRPHSTRGFWLTRLDNTTTDFSWLECVDRPSQRRDVLAAMRTAIADQKADFRAFFFASNPEARCPVTGQPLDIATCHVDHEPPLTFEKLAKDFIVEKKVDLEAVLLTGYGDGETSQKLADDGLRKAWQENHRQYARLRILSRTANLSITRRA